MCCLLLQQTPQVIYCTFTVIVILLLLLSQAVVSALLQHSAWDFPRRVAATSISAVAAASTGRQWHWRGVGACLSCHAVAAAVS